jgi:hypothetical protein
MALPLAHVSAARRARLEKRQRQNLVIHPHLLVPSSQVVNPTSTQQVKPDFDSTGINPTSFETDAADFVFDGKFPPIEVRQPDSSYVVIHDAWTSALIKGADAIAATLCEDLNVNRDRSSSWNWQMTWYCRDLIPIIEKELEQALQAESGELSDPAPHDEATDPDVIAAWRHAIARLKGIAARDERTPIDTTWISPAFTPLWFAAELKHWSHVAPAVTELVLCMEPSWEYARPTGHIHRPADDRPRYGDGMVTFSALLHTAGGDPGMLSRVGFPASSTADLNG